MVYKDLQKNLSNPSAEAIHSPSATATNTARPAWSHDQITKHNICNPIPQDPAHLTNQFRQPSSDIQDLKLQMKSLFEQLGMMLNLLSTILSKLT
jgi:hypothetical protein